MVGVLGFAYTESIWFFVFNSFVVGCISISTYLSVSLVLVRLLPDFAMLRDSDDNAFNKRVYSILSFGWSGRAKDWQRFEEVSLVLAGLATPLVRYILLYRWILLPVIPGWHYYIPPLILLRVLCFQVLRWLTPAYYYEESFKLEAYITIQH
jgi:molybdopterin-containing oxidoreductase family membrane subunit